MGSNLDHVYARVNSLTSKWFLGKPMKATPPIFKCMHPLTEQVTLDFQFR